MALKILGRIAYFALGFVTCLYMVIGGFIL
jgi:hypothetical protein